MPITDTFRPRQDKTNIMEGLIRFGRVTKVTTTGKIAARITYQDLGYQTNFLPCLQKNTLGTQEHYVPVVGETVCVLHLATGAERGVILGSVYTKDNPPPYNTETVRGVVFSDGSYVIYDTASGGSYQINVAGQAKIQTGGNLTATVGGTLDATVTGNASIHAPTIILDAPAVKVTGTLWVDFIKPYQTSETIATPHVKNADGGGGGS